MSEHPFSYKIIYSARKTLAIQITADATVCVRAPKNLDLSIIDSFLKEKETWILKHLQNKKEAKENGYFHNQPLSDSDRIHYRILCKDHECNLWTYFYSRAKDSLGELLQHRESQLQLETYFCSRRSFRLCSSP